MFQYTNVANIHEKLWRSSEDQYLLNVVLRIWKSLQFMKEIVVTKLITTSKLSLDDEHLIMVKR